MLVILFGMDVEEIEGVTIYKQQIHEIIVYYTFLVCLVTIFTVKNNGTILVRVTVKKGFEW